MITLPDLVHILSEVVKNHPVQHNIQYHRRVPPISFHLNAHSLGLYLQGHLTSQILQRHSITYRKELPKAFT